jgi:hypothetical protein
MERNELMLWWPLVVAGICAVVFSYLMVRGSWDTALFSIHQDSDPTGFAVAQVMYGGGCLAMLAFFVLANWSELAAML